METNILDIAGLNAAIGLDDGDSAYSAAIGNTNIQDKDVDQLKNIISKGAPTGVDTNRTPEQVDLNARPDYMKDYEEALSRKFEKPEDDQTNYSKKAIEQFGSEYANISTRDDFENELKFRDAVEDHRRRDPIIQRLEDVIGGAETERSIIEGQMAAKLDKDDPDFEDNLKRRMDQFFDETGAINVRGKAKYAEIIGQYKSALQNKYQEAQQAGNQALVKHREFKSNLAAELKSFKPGGVELPEELAAHVNQYITSGKAKEWRDKTPDSPQEAAQKEILLAVIADPVARAHWINLLDERGQNYGAQKKARTFFKNN